MPTYLRLDQVAAIVMAPLGSGGGRVRPAHRTQGAPCPRSLGLPRVSEDLSGDLANKGSVCRVAIAGTRWLGTFFPIEPGPCLMTAGHFTP